MPASIQWREEPPDRRNRSFGRVVRFGSGRETATGYMAYSDRVGPGVMVLDAGSEDSGACVDLADALNQEGFTVLVPDLSECADPEALTRCLAAAEHLRDNWHPRLGAVALAGASELVAALGEQVELDALALYSGIEPRSVQSRTADFFHRYLC